MSNKLSELRDLAKKFTDMRASVDSGAAYANFIMAIEPAGIIDIASYVDGLQEQIKYLNDKSDMVNLRSGERSKLLFEAKNYWADRARLAEAEVARCDEILSYVRPRLWGIYTNQNIQHGVKQIMLELVNIVDASVDIYDKSHPTDAVVPPEKVWSDFLNRPNAHALAEAYNQCRADTIALSGQPQKVVELPPISRNEANFYDVLGCGFEAWIEAKAAHDFWNEAIRRCQKSLDAAGILWREVE